MKLARGMMRRCGGLLVVLLLGLAWLPAVAEEVEGTFDMTWPRMFIIGAPKCATTALYDKLRRHPQVCNSLTKEAQFFNHKFGRGEKAYRKFFPSERRGKVCRNVSSYIDASPDYLHSLVAPHNMLSAYGSRGLAQKRFVVVLRNPVDREYSWYNHLVRGCVPYLRRLMSKDKVETMSPSILSAKCHKNRHCSSLCYVGDDKRLESAAYIARIGSIGTRSRSKEDVINALRTFDEFVDVSNLTRSSYAESLQNWLRVVSRQQLLVLSFDTVTKNKELAIDAITDFYGIQRYPPHLDNSTSVLPRINAASKDPHMKTVLQCRGSVKLSRIMQTRNDALFALLEKSAAAAREVGGKSNRAARPVMEPDFPPFRPPKCV